MVTWYLDKWRRSKAFGFAIKNKDAKLIWEVIPGMKYGLAAFGVYVLADLIGLVPKKSHGHGHGHDSHGGHGGSHGHHDAHAHSKH